MRYRITKDFKTLIKIVFYSANFSSSLSLALLFLFSMNAVMYLLAVEVTLFTTLFVTFIAVFIVPLTGPRRGLGTILVRTIFASVEICEE